MNVYTTTPPPPPVEAEATIIQPGNKDEKVKKVIVAVHGIGDQQAFSTLQLVVNWFCTHFGEPSAIPLGSFHKNGELFSIPEPFSKAHFEPFVFAEVYWAQIPRNINDKRLLEETKKWANTIVERLRLRWKIAQTASDPKLRENAKKCKDSDFTQIKLILGELIDTISILEKLSFFLSRLGMFSFDLKGLLTNYLGDVQIVADFETGRGEILKTFADTMHVIKEKYSNADIYIVAHSEGTVVSFLGMLEALKEMKNMPDNLKDEKNWLEKVKGFMTIGSPIDKHLILWPELFKEFESLIQDEETWKNKIEWRNYYDKADPIGFELDDARAWLKDHNLDKVFNFEKSHDMGFSRYALPGKAHNDYWTDKRVYEHFIKDVIFDEPEKENIKKPDDIRINKWVSVTLPYFAIFTVFFVANYILFSSLFSFRYPTKESDVNFSLLLGTTILLFGATITTRIPRLSNLLSHQIMVWIFYAGCAALSIWILPGKEEKLFTDKLLSDIYLQVLIITSMTVVGYIINKVDPTWGMTPFLVLGAILILTTVVLLYNENLKEKSPSGAIWHLVLSVPTFLYLWWLVALAFDLIFVWHLYIRQLNQLRHIAKYKDFANTTYSVS